MGCPVGSTTGIAWTEATWNPIRGCSRVSEGCRHCYAEIVAARFSNPGQPYHDVITNGRWNSHIAQVESHLLDPLRWQKPRMIFVNSMSDLFHENLETAAIDRIVAVMCLAYWHTFQVLTKRPERMYEYLTRTTGPGNVLTRVLAAAREIEKPKNYKHADSFGWPYKNIWWGTSVEDQKSWRTRIPVLQDIGGHNAAVLWASIEPQIGEIMPLAVDSFHLGWLVPGGESAGEQAREFKISWAQKWIEYGRRNALPVFVKQLGSKPVMDAPDYSTWVWKFKGKNDDPALWPPALRVREYPNRLGQGTLWKM